MSISRQHHFLDKHLDVVWLFSAISKLRLNSRTMHDTRWSIWLPEEMEEETACFILQLYKRESSLRQGKLWMNITSLHRDRGLGALNCTYS